MTLTTAQEEIHRQRLVRTIRARKEEWERNIRANASRPMQDASMFWVDGEGRDAICAAAGPSLEDDMVELGKMREGRELIAVDAAARFLIDRGLVPDYVVAADSSEKLAGMIRGLGRFGSRLILNVAAHPSTAEAWGGDISWFVAASSIYDATEGVMISQKHQRLSRVSLSLFSGGNVSSMALGFAVSVRRAPRVDLFGHDFCWKNKMYCGGAHADLEKDRLESEGRAGTIFEVKNTRGEMVLTNLSLQKFAEWHAQVVAISKGRVVNRTRSSIL